MLRATSRSPAKLHSRSQRVLGVPQTWGRHSQSPLPPTTLFCSKSREKAAHVSSSVGGGGYGPAEGT